MAGSSEQFQGQQELENLLAEFVNVKSGREETPGDPNSHARLVELSTAIFEQFALVLENQVKKGKAVGDLVKKKDALLLAAKCHPEQAKLRAAINAKKLPQLDVIMKQTESGRNPFFSGPRHAQFLQWLKDAPDAAFAKDCKGLADNIVKLPASFVCPNLLLLQLSNLVKHRQKLHSDRGVLASGRTDSEGNTLVESLLSEAITPMIKATPAFSSLTTVAALDKADFAVKLVEMLQLLDGFSNFQKMHLDVLQSVKSELAACLRMSAPLYREIGEACIPTSHSAFIEISGDDALNITVTELNADLWQTLFPLGLEILAREDSLSAGGSEAMFLGGDGAASIPEKEGDLRLSNASSISLAPSQDS